MFDESYAEFMRAIAGSVRSLGTAKTAFARAGRAAILSGAEFVVPSIPATLGDIAIAKMTTANGGITAS